MKNLWNAIKDMLFGEAMVRWSAALLLCFCMMCVGSMITAVAMRKANTDVITIIASYLATATDEEYDAIVADLREGLVRSRYAGKEEQKSAAE